MINSEADDIENVQHQFRNTTKDTHRADKKNTKQKSEQVNNRNDETSEAFPEKNLLPKVTCSSEEEQIHKID